jgi:lipoprotein-anchoring transpeptidase ErfK/SrfK
MRRSGSRRGVAVVVAALAVLAAFEAPADASAPRAQRLVVVLVPHRVRTEPSVYAHAFDRVAARRPLTRVRTVLPVLGDATSADLTRWLRVRLPGRPNGRAGWIPAAGTRREATGWRLVTDLSSRRVIVSLDGRVVRRMRAVVGSPSTPTPRGHFFIEEALELAITEAGGPFALATSARSEVLQEFAGGPGQIAIHGTNNLAGMPGSAVSHGCIRLGTRDITWLAQRIGAGVPLTIRR